MDDLQLKVNPKEQGLEVFRQTLLKMKDEDLKLMSHLSAEDFLSTVENVQDLALSASSKDWSSLTTPDPSINPLPSFGEDWTYLSIYSYSK